MSLYRAYYEYSIKQGPALTVDQCVCLTRLTHMHSWYLVRGREIVHIMCSDPTIRKRLISTGNDVTPEGCSYIKTDYRVPLEEYRKAYLGLPAGESESRATSVPINVDGQTPLICKHREQPRSIRFSENKAEGHVVIGIHVWLDGNGSWPDFEPPW